MKKQVTLVLIAWFICNLGVFAQNELPVKENLPDELLQSSLNITGADGAKNISTVAFDPKGNYTVEVSSTVVSGATGRGMDIEARSGHGIGFRTSLSDNSLRWAAPFADISQIATTEGGTQITRYAVKDNQAHVYLNGEYAGAFNLVSPLGYMNEEGSAEVFPGKPENMYYGLNRITNPDFRDDVHNGAPSGWVSSHPLNNNNSRIQQKENTTELAAYPDGKKALYVKFQSGSGAYCSYAVPLKPDTWYEYSFDLISWGGPSVDCTFEFSVSKLKDAASDIIYTENMTSPSVNAVPVRTVVRFETPHSGNETDVYYLVYKRIDNKNIGITDLFLLPEEETVNMYAGVNLITNPDFACDNLDAKPYGWVSNQPIGGNGNARVQQKTGNAGDQLAHYPDGQKGFMLRFQNNAGTYYSYPVTLKPDTWYEYSLDVILWGRVNNYIDTEFDLIVSKQANATSDVIFTQTLVTPDFTGVDNGGERRIVHFKTPASGNTEDVYYLVHKKISKEQNVGITDLYLQEKPGSLLFGKNYTAGSADMHIDYIRVDYSGAFAPFSELTEKKTLPEKLTANVDITGVDGAKNTTALPFDPVGDYTVEVSSTVVSGATGRGMDIEARAGGSYIGFRTSLSDNLLQWAAPFADISQIATTTGGKQVVRYAVKNNQAYVYLNGNYVDIFDLASIGDMDAAGTAEVLVPAKPADMYDNINLIANPDFRDDEVNAAPAGWVSGPGMGSGIARVQQRNDDLVGQSGYTTELSAYPNLKKAFFVRFQTLAVGVYYAYPVTLKPDTWYEYSFDLIAWGAGGVNIDFDFIVSKEANATSGIIYTENMTSPSVNAVPVRTVVRFKTPSSGNTEDVYHLVYKKTASGNNDNNIGITDLYLQEKPGSLLYGKNYTDGSADIHIDYIRVDYSGAFAPGPENGTSVENIENIESAADNRTITIYSEGKQVIVRSDAPIDDVAIYDLSGRCLLRQPCNEAEFSTSLLEGIYIIRLNTGGSHHIRKFAIR